MISGCRIQWWWMQYAIAGVWLMVAIWWANGEWLVGFSSRTDLTLYFLCSHALILGSISSHPLVPLAGSWVVGLCPHWSHTSERFLYVYRSCRSLSHFSFLLFTCIDFRIPQLSTTASILIIFANIVVISLILVVDASTTVPKGD